MVFYPHIDVGDSVRCLECAQQCLVEGSLRDPESIPVEKCSKPCKEKHRKFVFSLYFDPILRGIPPSWHPAFYRAPAVHVNFDCIRFLQVRGHTLKWVYLCTFGLLEVCLDFRPKPCHGAEILAQINRGLRIRASLVDEAFELGELDRRFLTQKQSAPVLAQSSANFAS